MAEEFYTVPESPEYNAAAIRKIQDTDPVRASTIVNPVVQQMINLSLIHISEPTRP